MNFISALGAAFRVPLCSGFLRLLSSCVANLRALSDLFSWDVSVPEGTRSWGEK